MKQRLYIDTSVFGGCYDKEFEEFTKPLFERIMKDEFILLFSTVTQDELENAPTQVREMVRQLKVENTEFIEITEEAVELATQYIAEKLLDRQVMLTAGTLL